MWVRRIARRMPWSRNSLRRGSDRIQAWLTLAVVMVTLVAAPWLAIWAASTTYRAEAGTIAWERQHFRPVPAVLARDATARSLDGGEVLLPSSVTVQAPARWTGRDGTVRVGSVSVSVGTPAGSTVTAWVDDRENVAAAPQRRSPTTDASMTATLAVFALVFLLNGVRRIVIWRLDRRRLHSWEAEWLIVGPRWSRR